MTQLKRTKTTTAVFFFFFFFSINFQREEKNELKMVVIVNTSTGSETTLVDFEYPESKLSEKSFLAGYFLRCVFVFYLFATQISD